MEQERSAYLFDKYISKTCSPTELEEFMAIVRNADDDAVLDLLLDNLWNRSPEAALDPIKADLILNQVLSPVTRGDAKKLNLSLQWLGWAAAFIIICLATFFLNRKSQINSELENKTVVQKEIVDRSKMLVTASTTTAHQKITLPDGSTVILNNNSSITYPKAFGKTRTVMLKGEGYFDIRHDLDKSFIVQAGKLTTTVLGTAFNIKAYENDREILVTVTRGKVSVLDSNAVLAILKPNEQIVFNKKDKQVNLAKVIIRNTIQWQESDIFFDDISMEEAAEVLSKRFNTPITFENNLTKKCKFTATFLKGESLDEILKIICAYNNAQYRTTAGGITIQGEGCDS